MSIFAVFIQFLVSLFVFLFFFWRRMREDFDANTVFKSGFLMVVGFGVGELLLVSLIPRFFPSSVIFSYAGLWFWGGLVGLALGFFASQKLYKLPLYEALEGAVVGFLFAAPVVTKEWVYSLIAVAAYYFLKSRYKSFNWYKSGKVGFAGLSSLGIFFLLRSLLALAGSSMIIFTGIGRVEVVVCAALAFLCFFFVYNLSL